MAVRRPLTQGLKAKSGSGKTKEEQFVYGAENTPAVAEPPPQPLASVASVSVAEPAPQPPATVSLSPSLGRMSFSTKLRADIHQALKRASLERQLREVEPNTVQEIVEDALESWLYKHKHLS